MLPSLAGVICRICVLHEPHDSAFVVTCIAGGPASGCGQRQAPSLPKRDLETLMNCAGSLFRAPRSRRTSDTFGLRSTPLQQPLEKNGGAGGDHTRRHPDHRRQLPQHRPARADVQDRLRARPERGRNRSLCASHREAPGSALRGTSGRPPSTAAPRTARANHGTSCLCLALSGFVWL